MHTLRRVRAGFSGEAIPSLGAPLRRPAAIALKAKKGFDGAKLVVASRLLEEKPHESAHLCRRRAGRAVSGRRIRFSKDPGLLLGGQPGEFHARDQHHRHQLRRGAAGLQSADRIQARHDRSRPRPRRELGGRPTAARRSPSICARASSSIRYKDFKPTRDFDADDVLFSIDRQWKPDNPYYKVSGGKYDYFNDMDMPKLLDSVEKTDDYTVVMKLKTPNVAILANLAMDFMAIGSEEYADFLLKKGTPEQFDQAPVGTGPFSFVSYQKDSRHPLQGEQGLLRREGAGRRPRLRHHARRHGALRQAEGGRVPRQRLSSARRPRGDGEGPDAEGDQHAGPQRRLLGLQRAEAAVRQEGGAAGACRWRSIATRSSRTSISARRRRRRR